VIKAALGWTGRQGPLVLIAGLVVGLLSPASAEIIRPWIGALITLLLVVTGARVGLKAAFGVLRDLGPVLRRIGAFQVAMPLLALLSFLAMGVSDHPLALAVVLMLAAPSVTGAPNFAIMAGARPEAGLRLLVLGTAVFPITAFVVFLFINSGSTGAAMALRQSLGLLVVVVGAVGLGFLLRRVFPTLADDAKRGGLDGFAALLLAVLVIGLMSEIGPLLRADPLSLVGWILATCAINMGLVIATYVFCKRFQVAHATATAIYAGNRNIALFLVVLPNEIAAPIMVFVGCYQIPMYLTPLLARRLRQANLG
jgi:hypothetical protein